MKKLIVTSKNYTGKVDLIYVGGIIGSINFQDSAMTDQQRAAFKKSVPVLLEQMEAFCQATGVMVVEEEVEISFDMFWKAYEKKINKLRAQGQWGKLSTSDRIRAYQGVPQYDRYLKANPWRTKMDPENYIKNKFWESEI